MRDIEAIGYFSHRFAIRKPLPYKALQIFCALVHFFVDKHLCIAQNACMKQTRNLTIRVTQREFAAITKAAAAARMSRGAWMLRAAEEKLGHNLGGAANRPNKSGEAA